MTIISDQELDCSGLACPMPIIKTRSAARAIETKVFADAMRGYYDDLIAEIKAGNTRTFNRDKWEPTSWPARAQGLDLWRRRAARWGTGW